MEINGILTKMMFDHDRLNRAFYIEESYVIQWMYPYLSPHGLIMKINKDKVPYDRVTAEKDADFWDWYVRRLTKDPMYRRDFAGQKSFSKLRAAIAGLYVRQGRYREAMQAYREACLLYPASPEATFRYAQECLLPFSKWDEVLDMMDFTDRVDPNNKRTINLRNYVERVRHLTSERVRLEAKRKGKEFSREDAFQLATCYSELGRSMEGAQLIRNYLPATTDVGELKLMAMMFLDAGLVADAEIALNKYLKANPTSDAMMWIELSKLQHRNGRKRAAQQSFINGYRINSQEIFRLLQKDQELYEIAAPLFQKRN
jgi:tetratricopeptide (TPR) repeat protein